MLHHSTSVFPVAIVFLMYEDEEQIEFGVSLDVFSSALILVIFGNNH